MRARLQTALGQHLAITPQLQVAFRLLQLPAAELAGELAEAVASNPLLEWAEGGGEAEATPAGEVPDAMAGGPDGDGLSWPGPPAGGEEDGTPEAAAGEPGLQDHLRWQLHLLPLSRRDRAIAAALVDALEEDGYLRAPLAEIVATLRPDWQVDEDQVLAVLRLVQGMDPPGIGARDLAECLRLQLAPLPAATPGRTLALGLAAGWLDRLPRLGAEGLARQLRLPRAEVDTAIALLRSLDPRPGLRHSPLREGDLVLPDLVIWRAGGRWQVRLGAHAGPPVAINLHYAGLIDRCGEADAGYLRHRLQEARWLLKGLEARGQTLLRVGRALVRHQAAYLEAGDAALVPLTLRALAAELEVHESTVSRAIAGKYVNTPRGTVPLRHFFSQAVDGGDGDGPAGTAVQAQIRRLVEAEDPRKPLSDARLVQKLQEGGITVARRTVAKYREAMGIPPSHERVRMA